MKRILISNGFHLLPHIEFFRNFQTRKEICLKSHSSNNSSPDNLAVSFGVRGSTIDTPYQMCLLRTFSQHLMLRCHNNKKHLATCRAVQFCTQDILLYVAGSPNSSGHRGNPLPPLQSSTSDCALCKLAGMMALRGRAITI